MDNLFYECAYDFFMHYMMDLDAGFCPDSKQESDDIFGAWCAGGEL